MGVRLMMPQYVAPTTLMGSGSTTLSTLYTADRMWQCNLRRPMRSADNDPPNGGGGLFTQKFDAGANGLWVADTFVSYANFKGPTLEFNATDSWGSPSASVAMAHYNYTITLSVATLAGCKCTYASATWTAHELAGKVFSTNVGNFVITDNSATEFWCQGSDIDGATGTTAYILEPRSWRVDTRVEYRYMRYKISAVQTTYNGTFDQVTAIGVSMLLPSTASVIAAGTRTIVGTDVTSAGGGYFRSIQGPVVREWTVMIAKPTSAEYRKISRLIENAGQTPLVLIPDTNNAFDWAFVRPALSTAWSGRQTEFTLREVA